MPHTKSVLKRQRKEKENYDRNKHRKSQMKSAIKKVLAAQTKAAAETVYSEAVSIIDKLANEKVIHKNTAARRKSQITNYLNTLS